MPRPVTPLLTVDCVAFDAKGRVLLIRRRHPPFAGCYALPGGFVDLGETVEDACRRELLEETGLAAVKIALIGVYSDPLRDPRGPTVSVAYLAEIEGRPTAGDDAAAAVWVAGWQRKVLAFDHRQILEAASKRWRRRSMRRGGKRK